MKYQYRGSQIFYKFINNKSESTNVVLHGWGCDHNSLWFVEKVSSKQNYLFVDFPPFGKSGEISGWSIFTYANMVISLCQHLNLQKINLIGHSFGGRVSILMAVFCKKQVEKLVLVDSAGLKPHRSLKYRVNLLKYKLKKRFGKDVSNCGSADYLALSEDMRKIFVSIVNTHLDDFLPFIEAETLIVFGKADKETPVYMAKKLHKKIKNSHLQILSNAGHFCFNDSRLEFVLMLKKFLEG